VAERTAKGQIEKHIDVSEPLLGAPSSGLIAEEMGWLLGCVLIGV